MGDWGEWEDRPVRRPPLGHAVGIALRAGRARALLSQREAARRAGLAQSTWARLETGCAGVSLDAVLAALASMGRDLQVSGGETDVDPVPLPARDAAGRRLPAHGWPYWIAQPRPWWPHWVAAASVDEPEWSWTRPTRPDPAGQPGRPGPA